MANKRTKKEFVVTRGKMEKEMKEDRTIKKEIPPSRIENITMDIFDELMDLFEEFDSTISDNIWAKLRDIPVSKRGGCYTRIYINIITKLLQEFDE